MNPCELGSVIDRNKYLISPLSLIRGPQPAIAHHYSISSPWSSIILIYVCKLARGITCSLSENKDSAEKNHFKCKKK